MPVEHVAIARLLEACLEEGGRKAIDEVLRANIAS